MAEASATQHNKSSTNDCADDDILSSTNDSNAALTLQTSPPEASNQNLHDSNELSEPDHMESCNNLKQAANFDGEIEKSLSSTEDDLHESPSELTQYSVDTTQIVGGSFPDSEPRTSLAVGR